LFDSAALYEDIWIWLARLAEHTDIDLGTAVLVPNLRHVMTTASAIATVEGISPGRLACGFGTGATARWVLNKPALTWATTRRYLEQLKGLLRGEVVVIDGERCQMIHHPDWAAARPLDVPLLLSAFGPKGKAVLADLYEEGVVEGYIGMADVGVDVPWRVSMTTGTVLEDGESITSDRVAEAVGPWYVVRYHGVWQAFPEAIGGMPGGEQWLAGIEAERPEGERHLAVHEGHVTNVMPRDREALSLAGDALATAGWVGTPDEIHARAVAAEQDGATEILYTPTGDFQREMRKFAEAVRG
jgi:5,10-methylenetetrahydromethanopterin reductase